MEVLSDLYRTGQKEHPDGKRQGLDLPEGLNEEIDQGHHQDVAEAAADERDPGEPGGDEDLQEEEGQGEAKVYASKGHGNRFVLCYHAGFCKIKEAGP